MHCGRTMFVVDAFAKGDNDIPHQYGLKNEDCNYLENFFWFL